MRTMCRVNWAAWIAFISLGLILPSLSAAEKESKIEADDEHYEEAHELLLTVKGLLAERENLLKDGGRKASSNEALSRFSRELEENTKWRKNNKEMINLLRLAL